MSFTSDHGRTANQQQLTAAVIGVQTALERYVAQLQGADSASAKAEFNEPVSAEFTALETIAAGFRLTPFEQNILLLCAGVELSASFAHLCATAQGNPQFTYPTFSLALAALPEAHWSALAPVAPLRRWRLIEVATGESLTQSRLRIDERVLHYLTGVAYLDDRLQGLIEPLPLPDSLSPSHQQLAQRLIKLWSNSGEISSWTIIHLSGSDRDSEAIAAAACAEMGMQLQAIQAIDIPTAIAEREALARLWERETVLSHSALLVSCAESPSRDRLPAIVRFIETVHSLVIMVGQEPLPIRKRPVIRLAVDRLTTHEQLTLWQTALGTLAPTLNGQLEPLVAQFHLSPQAIQQASLQLKTQLDSPDLPDALWKICRIQSRSQLDDLAQLIQPIATWEDLVLPEPQRQLLREMVAQVKHRIQVYETWEFAVRSANGLGISALFAGASGTGKTLAAEVLAHELRLDLYRIDLSQVVSKYIGETEKNLRRVFDAAEAGGAILLFDEADALFGKRSEVKDSHDRYANIEVSYLLQRIEAYWGLAILTTNLRSAIDPAFLRRIRFVVQFPFPEVSQRLEIWRRMFPAKLPTSGLNLNKLARLNIPGGNIRNIALNAAFLAADAKEPVQMCHLLRSAQSEYAKLDKTLTDAEAGGWI